MSSGHLLVMMRFLVQLRLEFEEVILSFWSLIAIVEMFGKVLLLVTKGFIKEFVIRAWSSLSSAGSGISGTVITRPVVPPIVRHAGVVRRVIVQWVSFVADLARWDRTAIIKSLSTSKWRVNFCPSKLQIS